MKILIVAATKKEIEPFILSIKIIESINDTYYYGEFNSHEITISITGIGMVATSYFTTKALSKKYDLAINAGICGSFNKNLEIGDVVNIYEDCFSELGAEDDAIFLTLEEIGLKAVQKISGFQFQVENKIIGALPKINGITVNKIHGNEKSIEAVYDKFHPYVESMEGAAFMFVCEKENIPFLQIRAVSNYVEKRNKNNWNIPLAIKNLNEKIIEVIDSIQQPLTPP